MYAKNGFCLVTEKPREGSPDTLLNIHTLQSHWEHSALPTSNPSYTSAEVELMRETNQRWHTLDSVGSVRDASIKIKWRHRSGHPGLISNLCTHPYTCAHTHTHGSMHTHMHTYHTHTYTWNKEKKKERNYCPIKNRTLGVLKVTQGPSLPPKQLLIGQSMVNTVSLVRIYKLGAQF